MKLNARAILNREVKSRLLRLGVLRDGLEGRICGLTTRQGEAMVNCLEGMGIRLISRAQAKLEGLELRRGQKGVASYYCPAPISEWTALYLVDQFQPAKTGKAALRGAPQLHSARRALTGSSRAARRAGR
jgi:hypothetical protein